MSAPVCLSVGEDLKLWDSKTLKLLSSLKIPSPATGGIASCVWSPKGDVVAFTARVSPNYSTVFLADVSRKLFLGNTTDIFEQEHAGEKISRTQASFSSSSQFLACATVTGQIDVYNRKTCAVVKTYTGTIREISALAYSTDDSLLLSGDMNGNITFQPTNQEESVVLHTKREAVLCLRQVPYNNALFSSAHLSGSICVVDLATQEVVQSFTDLHLAACRDIAFSPIHPFMAASVGLDDRVVLCDMRTNKTLNVIQAQSSLTSVTFLPNGNEVLCGTSTGKVLIFDLQKGPAPQKMIPAHNSVVVYLAMQPEFRKEKLQQPDSSVVHTGYKVIPKKPDSSGQPKRTSGNPANPVPSEPSKNFLLSKPMVGLARTGSKSSGDGNRAAMNGGSRSNESVKVAPIMPLLPLKSAFNGSGDGLLMPPPPHVPSRAEVFTVGAPSQQKTILSSPSVNCDPVLMKEIIKSAQDMIILESRISCLDVQDVVHEYGSSANQRLLALEEKVEHLQDDMRSNKTILMAILGELRALKPYAPY